MTTAEQADIWHTVYGANGASKHVAHVLWGQGGQWTFSSRVAGARLDHEREHSVKHTLGHNLKHSLEPSLDRRMSQKIPPGDRLGGHPKIPPGDPQGVLPIA